ncbi:MAG: phosphoglucosamine mutase, partial [Candidatus Korarchaeota archaeon]|nr:phosphoglucosamine mutase [Candidatus Korarchaeota archaeon]
GVGEKIEELDGIKVIFEDTSWVLLRPSGTEPVFRCRVDAPTEERAYELKRMAISLLKEILGRKCY